MHNMPNYVLISFKAIIKKDKINKVVYINFFFKAVVTSGVPPLILLAAADSFIAKTIIFI